MTSPVKDSLASGVNQAAALAGQAVDAAGKLADKVVDKIAAAGESVILMKDSTALAALVYTAEKNQAYVSREIVPMDPEIFVSRVYYCETGLVGFISLIHNFVLTFIFAICAAVNLGADAQLNFTAKKFLLLTAISGVCTGIGIVGVASPAFADQMKSSLVHFMWENRDGIYSFLGTRPNGL